MTRQAASRQPETQDQEAFHESSIAAPAAVNEELAPIALGPGEGEALWFLGFLTTIKASAETTGGRVAVIEHLAPRGAGSPLHVHRREDEWFYVHRGRADLLGRRPGDRGSRRIVRLRPARRSRTPSSSAPTRRGSCSSPSPQASRLPARARRARRRGSRSRRPPPSRPTSRR